MTPIPADIHLPGDIELRRDGDGAVAGAHTAANRQHAAGHQKNRAHPGSPADARQVLNKFHALRFIHAPAGILGRRMPRRPNSSVSAA